MTIALWVAEAAEEFWRLAGTEEPFPRTLRRPISDALALTLVQVPHLRIAAAEVWLRRCGVVCAIGVGDRPLHAALVARYGYGVLFLDGADSDDEQRFSLAHELAHFLRHYRQLRARVEGNLGVAALEVLDGVRPARRTERVHALLAGVPIGYYVHLMQRDSDGGLPDDRTARAEREADLLAYELLAPAALVSRQAAGVVPERRQRAAAEVLGRRYGFPEMYAADYAAQLFPTRAESFLHRLS
ncbi:MAG TPA: ImmA/IrrE family metallo-endopeptidase, partial [Chloroflexota bacterium]|nr:ImmA/IrrE family metallo-endopeptidase [Chloroflexota bacterium]